MRKKRIMSLVLVAAMAMSLLAGCGSADTAAPAAAPADNSAATASDSGDTAETEVAAATAAPAVNHDEELTIEIYDVAANYQGLQAGWYGKVLKDKFNIVLNIIAPQVSGDAASLYQTRTASGNLGDIVILDNADLAECADVGLIADLSGEIQNYPNLMRYEEQIMAFNKGLGDGTHVYAIPTEMNTNGPTAYVEDSVYSCPRMAWDYYQELGAPEMANTDDLLNVLKQMMEAHPTNEAGDKAYAISLWPDWDGTSIETVNQITKWYGQEVNGSILIDTESNIMPLTDKNGAYYRMLKFFFQANQMGLVDPDSATQDWTAACDKMQNKRVYLFWYNWQRGFWNTPARSAERNFYVATPLDDMNVFQASDTYYGSGRVWGVGSQVSDENRARILEFLDWLASPESCMYQHDGIEGVTYVKNADGKYEVTEDGFNRFSSEVLIPEEFGGGNFQDGNNQVNQWIVAGVDTNPETGESYSSDYWATTIAVNQTVTTKEWSERFEGAENEVEYLKNKGMLNPVASINISLVNDTTDISLIRNQCGDIICDSSWKMIFASDEAQFDQMWDDMCTQIEGFGWDQLVEFDTQKYQPVLDARKAAN